MLKNLKQIVVVPEQSVQIVQGLGKGESAGRKMNGKRMILLGVAVVLVISVLCLCGGGNTLFDDPEDMAEGAMTCIRGWRDPQMLMELTPYREGTEIYDIAYSYFQDMMRGSGRMSEFHTVCSGNLQRMDRALYNELKGLLEDYGIDGVKSVKSYTYQDDRYEEITIYVAQIGRKWYTVMAE